MTKTLIARRDKVVAAWINQVCPVVDPALSADGTLTFANAAVDAKAATRTRALPAQWFRFDNATDQRTPVGEPMTVSGGSARAPDGLMSSDFVGVSVTAAHARQPGWATPSTFFFRRGGPARRLVARRRRTRTGETAGMMNGHRSSGQP